MGLRDFLIGKLRTYSNTSEIKERTHDSGSYYGHRDPISEYYRDNTTALDERSKTYKDMDDLDNDIISTVLDMGADDATQTDLATGKSLWCASDDPKYKTIIDAFFNRVKIEDKLWRWGREIYKYGDFFLRVNPGEGRIKGIDDTAFPSRYCRIESYGTLVGFLDKYIYNESPNLQGACLLPPFSVVHFRTPRYRIVEDLLPREIIDKYEIDTNPLYGSSAFLKARKIEKRIALINDALAMTRLARSTVYRIHSINVGDLTNTTQRKKVLQDYENMIRKAPGINLDSNKANIDVKGLSFFRELFIPKDQDGKGQSEINDIGGNVDVSGIADIEFLNSQRFGVLGVPKAYLSFDEAQAFNSLIALDTRYARKIVTLQKALISGITALCQIELALHDLEPDTSKFTIHLVPVSTNGELDRNDALNAVIEICNNIKSFFDGENINKDYITRYLVTNYLKFPNFDLEEVFVKTETEEPAVEESLEHIERKIDKIIKENDGIRNRINRIRTNKIEPSEIDLYEAETLNMPKNLSNKKQTFENLENLKRI